MKQFMLAGLALQLCALPALAADKTAAVPSNAPTTMTTADPHPMAPATTAKPMTSPADSSMSTTGTVARPDQAPSTAKMAAVPGANSFTESQARGRLEKNGYSQVTGLTKDKDGIWRGSAMKNGSSVQVTVDYKGNISVN